MHILYKTVYRVCVCVKARTSLSARNFISIKLCQLICHACVLSACCWVKCVDVCVCETRDALWDCAHFQVHSGGIFLSTFPWNSDTGMTHISCHFHCQTCVCVCVYCQLFPSPILHESPSIMCLQRHFTIMLMHNTKCQKERSPHCYGLQPIWSWVNLISHSCCQTSSDLLNHLDFVFQIPVSVCRWEKMV